MQEINFQYLSDIISRNAENKVLLTFHSIGDTDCISSAFALQKLFKDATIVSPDFVTGNSKRIIEKFGFSQESIKGKFDQNADIVILLDVNNFEDCGKFMAELEAFKGSILVIDHHTPNKIDKENVIMFNDESYNSTASVIYDLLKRVNADIDKNLANLIATGIISDSAELRNAFPNTFIQIGELLQKSGMDYQSLLLEMQHVASPEVRKDFITDLFAAKITLGGGLLMLHGTAKFHANKIADDAIKIGADLSLFYTINRGKEVSFSARLRPPLDKIYKINLGKMMKSLAPLINGQGGGHPCAAGAYGSNTLNAEEFLSVFISEVSKKTEARPK